MLSRSMFSCAGAVLFLALAVSANPALAAWPHSPTVNLPLCTAPDDQAEPQLVSDGADGVIVTWHDFRNLNFDIYAQHVTAAGVADPAWSVDGVALCTATNHQWDPRLVSDGAGGAIVTWRDNRGGSDYDIYAQHVTAAGVADPTWPVDGVALCTATNHQMYPQIASDGAGGAIVTWYDERSGISGTRADIYAQHVTAAGVVDPAWPVDGLAVCTATNHQAHPQLLSDGSGGAIVTWSDSRSGAGNDDVYAQHVTAAGIADPTWPVDGVALCTATQWQGSPQLVSDGAGGAIVTWDDYRSRSAYDVYAQHVTAAGVADPAWPVDGVAVCTATNHQLAAQLVPDGAGGAIVTWNDERSGNFDIYAQHVTAAGVADPSWPANGVALCIASGDQKDPQIVSHGSGGAIITWRDERSGSDFDIYAQHVTAAGVADPAWPVDGVAISTPTNDQEAPQLVSDGSGGAIITWTDSRGGDEDIYAQRLDRDGLLGSPEPAIVAVDDVPDDQGGKVHVLWHSSNRDFAPRYPTRSYTLWRQITTAAAQNAVASGATLMSEDEPLDGERPRVRVEPRAAGAVYWEFVVSVPARGLDHYGYMAPTTADSLPGFIPWNVFVVDAVDSTGLVFYTSVPDSGYSVDNLAPQTPESFSGEYLAGKASLHWMPNSEPDFAEYRLYRGKNADFVPGPGDLVVAQSDTGHVDMADEAYFYKLAAVDVHGNESPYAFLQPDGTVGVRSDPPTRFALYPSVPNPIRDQAVLRFDLPVTSAVSLSIYDARGRVVRRAIDRVEMSAGRHEWEWNGRDGTGVKLPPGIYLIRLHMPDRSRTQKVLIVN